MSTITHSEKQTIALANKFATKLKPGTVLGLVGDLGAGKTQFVKGLAVGLGIKDLITSPTFVMLKKYSTSNKKPDTSNLIHIDCYRLSNPQELLALGWSELIQNKDNIIVVEWADKIKSIMPAAAVWISFRHLKDDQRKITIIPR